MKKYTLKDILEALVDEIRDSGNPSELTLDILSDYEEDYEFIKEYLKNRENNEM